MERIMFGNSLMLLAIALFLMLAPGNVWCVLVLLASGLVMSAVGFVSTVTPLTLN